MQLNEDQQLLETQRVNPNDTQDVLSQALRIAAYDEFEAYNTYTNVIAKFGNVLPFSNIVEAETRHYNETLLLLQKYNIQAPNVIPSQVQLPDTLQECCELGIAAEIENIAMYDNLLQYVTQADVRDLFYRLQAASYNNHLPAFRKCVLGFYTQQNTTSNNMMDNIQEYQTLLEEAMSGNLDQNKIMNMLSNANMSLLSGLALGALGGVTLSNLNNKDNTNNEK